MVQLFPVHSPPIIVYDGRLYTVYYYAGNLHVHVYCDIQALKKVRHCGLKPYIVFIASPRLERLHVTRRMGSDKVKKRLGSTLQYQDSTIQKLHTVSTFHDITSMI